MKSQHDPILTSILCTGGYSTEREIALKSAQNTKTALEESGLEMFWLEISLQDWSIVVGDRSFRFNRHDASFCIDEQHYKVDYALIMMHGDPGENGKLGAYFELLNICHSTCSPFVSALTFNKSATIAWANRLGVACAQSISMTKDQYLNNETPNIPFSFPYYIKADSAGSSFGITRVTLQSEIITGLKAAFEESDSCIIEEGLVGKEVTCGVYRNGEGIQVLTSTEIRPHGVFFDYEAKYANKSDEITPAEISREQQNFLLQLTRNIYAGFSLKGLCRVDYILQENTFFLLEINTIPGMTKQSLVPQQIAYCKKPMGDIHREIMEYTKLQHALNGKSTKTDQKTV